MHFKLFEVRYGTALMTMKKWIMIENGHPRVEVLSAGALRMLGQLDKDIQGAYSSWQNNILDTLKWRKPKVTNQIKRQPSIEIWNWWCADEEERVKEFLRSTENPTKKIIKTRNKASSCFWTHTYFTLHAVGASSPSVGRKHKAAVKWKQASPMEKHVEE